MWRSAADRRRRVNAAAPAAASISVAFRTTLATGSHEVPEVDRQASEGCSLSGSGVPRLVDQPGETIEFRVRKFLRRFVQQGGDGLFGRTVKEGFQHVMQRGALRVVAAERRQVDIARAVLFVPGRALFLRESEASPGLPSSWAARAAPLELRRRSRVRSRRGCQ